MYHSPLLIENSNRPIHFISFVNHPMKLPIFGRIAGSWLLVKRFLDHRQGTGQPPINIELLPSEELIKPKHERLCGFRSQIGDRFVFFFCDFKLFLGKD